MPVVTVNSHFPIPITVEHHADSTTNKNSNNRLCTCKIIASIMSLAKLCGLFPYNRKHTNNGKCKFHKSPFWFTYSIILLLLLTSMCLYVVPDLSFDPKQLPGLLDSISSLINISYNLVAFVGILNYDKGYIFLMKITQANKEFLFCDEAKNAVMKLQRRILYIAVTLLLLQTVPFWYLIQYMDYNLYFHVLITRNMQVTPFVVSQIWMGTIKYFIAVFICFESATKNYLNYRPMHPVKKLDFSSNSMRFLEIFQKFKLCNDNHQPPKHLRNLTIAERLDFLRNIHEDLYQCVHSYLNYASVQIFIIFLMEIGLLTTSLFSIIFYTIYSFQNPSEKVAFAFNVIHVCCHTSGLFWVLNGFQVLTSTVNRLNTILIEYTLRTGSVEEHQQIRFFTNKIINQQPLTINDYFIIHLNVIAPLLGQVLTYVLVAFQIYIPLRNQK